MNQKRILIVLCLTTVVLGCRSVPSQQSHPDIVVTLHRPAINRMISDVSQRDPPPPQRSVRQNPDGSFTTMEPTEEQIETWTKKYTALADLIVKVTNASDHELRLFEEWNSWGYCNLKFVFGDGVHEYWVIKQPGLWYRNFSSWHALAPGKSFQIPVAFADHIWSGLDLVRANTNLITSVRALYEQYQVPMLGRADDVWRGSISSTFYPAAELLPRFGFPKHERMPDQEAEIEPDRTPPADLSDPDDVKIEIKM